MSQAVSEPDPRLEHRYRRLLALFPWAHRRTYEEEMLAVLMADARTGQRRPGLGDTANLAWCALRTRLGHGMRRTSDPLWRDASATLGLVAGVLLLALWLYGLLSPLALARSMELGYQFPGVGIVVPAGLWAAVVTAVLVGWRRVAAVLAWAAALFLLVNAGRFYLSEPVTFLRSLSVVLLSLIAAVALSVPAPPRRGATVLGRSGLWLLGGGALGWLVGALDDPTLWMGPEGGSYSAWPIWGGRYVGNLGMVLLVASTVAVLVALYRTGGPVRRRMLALVAPVAAMVLLIRYGFAGYVFSSGNFGSPIPLTAIQVLALVLVPLLTLLLGAALVQRRDETRRLVELGRTAEREQLIDLDGEKS